MLFLEQASRRKQSKDIVPEQEVSKHKNEVCKDIVLVVLRWYLEVTTTTSH
jgi:hypothetical protein